MTTPDPTQPSFDLGQDHLDLRDWLHGFAADVIRPVAAEWDEREEFPWPVLEEAAKAGIYSIDFVVAQALDTTVVDLGGGADDGVDVDVSYIQDKYHGTPGTLAFEARMRENPEL